MNGRLFRIGSRGSELALWQARLVQALLQQQSPRDEFPIEIIRTQGDQIQDRALYRVEDKGFFTKEIETALLAERIDLAVHSLKDLPVVSPPGLTLGAVPPREDPHDVWLSLDGSTPQTAPGGARVGTSSLRRQAQLRALRPDLVFEELRGNVPTRLRKLEAGEYQAVVLARAGMHRLGLLPANAFTIPFAWLLPAPGQGALGLQIRSGDAATAARVQPLEDRTARLAVTAERSLLSRLQGGCLVPVGAYADPVKEGPGRFRLEGMVADLTGTPLIRGSRVAEVGTPDQAEALGRALADELLDGGAGPILDAVRAFLRASQDTSRRESSP